jgi:hypothetical protein
MYQRRQAALYFLQLIPLLIFPPSILVEGILAVGVVAVAIVALGFMLLRKRAWALTMSIFIQGMNIVVRLMMLFPHALLSGSAGKGVDVAFVVSSILSIAISGWFLLRLDRPDIRMAVTA